MSLILVRCALQSLPPDPFFVSIFLSSPLGIVFFETHLPNRFFPQLLLPSFLVCPLRLGLTEKGGESVVRPLPPFLRPSFPLVVPCCTRLDPVTGSGVDCVEVGSEMAKSLNGLCPLSLKEEDSTFNCMKSTDSGGSGLTFDVFRVVTFDPLTLRYHRPT